VGEQVHAEEREQNLRNIRDETIESRIRAIQEGMSAREIGNLHEHLVRIDETIEHAGKEIVKAREETDKARVDLVEKRRDERAIELYRKRKHKVWLRDFYRDENRTLDDIGTILHVRGSGSTDERLR
jgi:flagellar export protein FliJ